MSKLALTIMLLVAVVTVGAAIGILAFAARLGSLIRLACAIAAASVVIWDGARLDAVRHLVRRLARTIAIRLLALRYAWRLPTAGP